MKYRKLIAVLLALLLLAALFAACGGEKDDETQPGLTLPTMDAPVASGNNGLTASEQGTKPVSTDDPFAETKDWMPGGQTGVNPENAADTTISTEFEPSDTAPPQTWPNSTDPDLTYPSLTDPETSEAVPSYDDSDEDLPATTTEAPDDTDEDLP